LAAFLLGLVLAIIFTMFYFTQAKTTYENYSEASAQQLSAIFAADMVENDLSLSNKAMDTFLSGRAMILDSEGQIVAGVVDRKIEPRTRSYPIQDNGERIGTLIYAQRDPYAPPIPYLWAAIICLTVAALSGLAMYGFANLVSRYINRVTRIVGDYSLKTSTSHDIGELAFAEFKRLGLATVRTTRRVSNEIASLRASALIDERTGFRNERAFDIELGQALNSVGVSDNSALITLEFHIQTPNQDRIAAGLPSDAHVEAAKRLKLFVGEAFAKYGANPKDWILASLFSDQFALLIRQSGPRDEVASLIRDLIGEFRAPLRYGNQVLSVNLHGSIVMIPEDGDTLAKVKGRAQATIEDLKANQKNGFSFYSPKLERQRDAKIKLETELRQAVSADRFIPLFQPKINLTTGEITGCEALARWRLENGRLVSPSVFIELAEETGLIDDIGDQIMRKACFEAAQWSQNGRPISLAVNVSPRQFESEVLGEKVLDALANSGLPPRQLEIEITESLAIQHPERVRSVLRPLRKLGIKLAVDDFGTGHSNLAVLTQFDFDVFKIDRQFVMDTPGDPQANAIVEMILSMADTLEMVIVGEGIETAAQAEFLTSRGCHIGQGYLYSPPVTADAFSKLLKEQPFMARKLSA